MGIYVCNWKWLEKLSSFRKEEYPKGEVVG